MTRLLCRLSLVLPCLLATGPLDAEPAPTEAVRRLLDAQVKAWNHGDLEGFMAGYWKSPELTFYSGKDVTHGWQETLERYRKRYKSDGAVMGKLAFRNLDIQVLGNDAAAVRGTFVLQRGKETATGLFTLLVKRFPEGWRIMHDHTSG